MANTVIRDHRLEEVLLRDTIVAGLQAAADAAGATYLVDPQAAGRAGNAPLVMTTFPSRKVLYPHIIAEEANDVSERPDTRVDLQEHAYDVAFGILAKSRTTLKKLKDGTKNWVALNTDTLRDAGWHDVRLISSTPANWDTGSRIFEHRLVYTGVLYTEPEPAA